jgi:hypothetical protein
MPVWHDVQRTRSATLLADEAPADSRPGQVLRQGVQSDIDIDHPTIALTARTLDVAGHVAVSDPFRRSAKRVFVCRLWVIVAGKPSRMIPRLETKRKFSTSCGSEHQQATADGYRLAFSPSSTSRRMASGCLNWRCARSVVAFALGNLCR